ncbi:tumor protein p53-inducible nuclear protein 2 isoform X3 [Bombus impatiens]|uniref:Tumor protein p53-inducible nuclear protein 2 isoform X3 n=1 Tax=Bombus impatiens TaxID=132113 RepID=A0A6P8L954_BOMIM|nr:tumor protein p53-inducible nuclear protein 2 isoform X3 [Bombus impatiens]
MLNGVYKVLVFIKRRKAISALKSKKKVRMLSSLANYLLGGNISGAQGSRQGSNNETPETHPVMARLSQVEIEGDDWILIDRTDNPASSTTFFDSILVDGTTALEESWYVTPPACFTRAGPVNVETSPLEDLLIEHPSMSVYRATAPSIAPETPPPTPDAPEERGVEEDALPNVASSAPVTATPASPERAPGRSQNGQQATRRPDTRDERPRARTEKRIVQLRSAQKVYEKRTTQALKRGRLERSNKLREVLSVKGKRPRRQDRLRIQNSGANNNRKC